MSLIALDIAPLYNDSVYVNEVSVINDYESTKPKQKRTTDLH